MKLKANMKNQSFREKYLVFQANEGGGAAPAAQPGSEPVKLVEAKSAGGGAEKAPEVLAGEAEALKALETFKAETGLSELQYKLEGEFKDKIEKNYTVLLEELNLGNKVVDNLVLGGDLELSGKDFKDVVRSRIADILKNVGDEKFGGIGKALGLVSGQNLDAAGAKEMMAAIYVSSFIRKIEKDIKEKDNYPLFDKFRKESKGSYKIEISGEFDGSTGFKNLKFIPNEDFVKAYEKFEADSKNKPDAPSKDVQEAAQNVSNTAGALRRHAAGRALIALGLVREYRIGDPDIEADLENKTESQKKKYVEELNIKQFESALNGENFFAGLVIWFAGGGAILEDGGKGYDEFLAGLDSKYSAILVKTKETLTKKSPVSLKKFAIAQRAKRVAGETSGGVSEMSVEKFKEIVISGGGEDKMPKEGLTLEADYDLKAQKLMVDFNGGGTVTLPRGSEMKVDGSSVRDVDKDVDYPQSTFAKEMRIDGIIPKGVVFKGPVKFKLERV